MAGIVPSNVTPEAAQAARDTIAAATTVAGQLPVGPASELLDAAREHSPAG
jgi:hypothetical protein